MTSARESLSVHTISKLLAAPLASSFLDCHLLLSPLYFSSLVSTRKTRYKTYYSTIYEKNNVEDYLYTCVRLYLCVFSLGVRIVIIVFSFLLLRLLASCFFGLFARQQRKFFFIRFDLSLHVRRYL